MFGTSASGQRAAIIGLVVVCSKAANGCSGRGVSAHTIAVKRVGKRLGAGGAGRRASAIGPPSRDVSGDGNRAGGIGSGCVSDQIGQLTENRRARASAQRQSVKIFQRGRVSGRVATTFSPFRMDMRASAFAAWPADWLCVASWIAKRVIGRGVGVGAVDV